MNLWSVEHFFNIFFIKIEFSCNQNIEERESNFDEKSVKELFNWSEVYAEKKYYKWNRDFSCQENLPHGYAFIGNWSYNLE